MAHRVLRPFGFSADGVSRSEAEVGASVELPASLVPGLLAEGYIAAGVETPAVETKVVEAPETGAAVRLDTAPASAPAKSPARKAAK